MNQPLNYYYIFYTAATYHSFSIAAKKLYISQPAVSKAISKLEDALCTQLFHRTTKGVLLTEAGDLLYKQLQIAFQAIDHGENEILTKGTINIGKLSIGTSTTLCKYVLLPYLRDHFIPQNPHVQLRITCQSSPKTIESLLDHNIDIALISETDRVPFYPLRSIYYSVVCTESYLKKLRSLIILDGKNYTTDSDLFAYATLLMLDTGSHTRQYVDRYLKANQIQVGQTVELGSTDMLIEFAKTGLGIAWVTRDYIEEELNKGTLVELSTKVPIPSVKIGIAYPPQTTISLPVERFIKGLYNFSC